MSNHKVQIEVNGKNIEAEVSGRTHLADFLRNNLNLTGTHIGCEHGVCGCCTVLMDEEPIRSCIILAVQADGHKIKTVEGMSEINQETGKRELSNIQKAFWEGHGLQCGFCTPGMLLTTEALLAENPDPTDQEIREALSGNICRCTGYLQIVEAVKLAAKMNKNSTLVYLPEEV
ncbi:(2Fe-2S)-binding protein [Alteribacillus sp. YIM 98480]|uniref:(2Fe-2S)-binding protein n=1 Tax=Alteribacillus sp. YIM 98480 TaxID=2606599 RepID=UPI0018EEDD25|nr:(2Fe-2S)-binding protein [Alteribacillus sp. YIM 98480]